MAFPQHNSLKRYESKVFPNCYIVWLKLHMDPFCVAYLQEAFEDDDDNDRLDTRSVHKEIDSRLESGEVSCFFDKSNKQSPCHFKPCDDEDDLRCVKYVLEYCGAYEDRGCVVNKPQLLNKKDFEEMAEMENSSPLFGPWEHLSNNFDSWQ